MQYKTNQQVVTHTIMNREKAGFGRTVYIHIHGRGFILRVGSTGIILFYKYLPP